jgi:hypothetical protein
VYSPWSALQRHNTESSKQKFPEKELRGLTPSFHIHVSVSDFAAGTYVYGRILGIYKSLADT